MTGVQTCALPILLEEMPSPLREQLSREVGRVHFYGASESEPAAYEEYINRLRNRIKSQGENNFPKKNGKSVYGRVQIELRITKYGAIENFDVLETTSRELTRYLTHLVRKLEPFEPFPPEISKDTDTMVFIQTLVFENDK